MRNEDIALTLNCSSKILYSRFLLNIRIQQCKRESMKSTIYEDTVWSKV